MKSYQNTLHEFRNVIVKLPTEMMIRLTRTQLIFQFLLSDEKRTSK